MDRKSTYRSLTQALRKSVGQRAFGNMDSWVGDMALTPAEVADRIIRGINVGVIRTPQINAVRAAGMFTLEIPQEIIGQIGDLGRVTARMEAVVAQTHVISGIMQGYVGQLVTRHIPTMRFIIEDVIRKNVYDTPAQITRYKGGEGKSTVTGQDYIRTYNLLYAFMSGFQHWTGGVKFVFNESLAPYWLWVEEGHRVVLPDGREPGIWIHERNFVEEYKEALNKYIDNVIIPQIYSYMSAVRDIIGTWTLWGEKYKQMAGGEYVKNYPGMYEVSAGDYRSPEFYRSVGGM